MSAEQPKSENNHEQSIEKVTSAALLINGEIFTGANHPEANEKFMARYPDKDIEDLDFIDGFLTNTGRFVNRTEAAAIANKARQIVQPPDDMEPWQEGLELDSGDLDLDVKNGDKTVEN
jgi:hypothetical protein